jgi:hypothetical protein
MQPVRYAAVSDTEYPKQQQAVILALRHLLFVVLWVLQRPLLPVQGLLLHPVQVAAFGFASYHPYLHQVLAAHHPLHTHPV